jgi:hypothetical protein
MGKQNVKLLATEMAIKILMDKDPSKWGSEAPEIQTTRVKEAFDIAIREKVRALYEHNKEQMKQQGIQL